MATTEALTRIFDLSNAALWAAREPFEVFREEIRGTQMSARCMSRLQRVCCCEMIARVTEIAGRLLEGCWEIVYWYCGWEEEGSLCSGMVVFERWYAMLFLVQVNGNASFDRHTVAVVAIFTHVR